MSYERIIRHGEEIAPEYKWGGGTIKSRDVSWALFCEAIKVARTWPSPPRSGFPAKSGLPDAPDDVSYFVKLQLALKTGDSLDDVGFSQAPRFMPSALDQTRAEIVLDAFHDRCLQVGDRKRLRSGVVALASGVKPIRVRNFTGLANGRLTRAKTRMCDELLDGIKVLTNSVNSGINS